MRRGKIEARIVHQSAKYLPRKKLMWRKNLAQDRRRRATTGIVNSLTTLNLPNRQA